MPARRTPSQIRSDLRRAQQQQRQAVQKFNRAIDDYNREVRRVNAHNQRIVANYNREVRAHNARVRANRQRLRHEIARLNAQSPTTTVRFVTYRTSVQALQQSFERVEASSIDGSWNASDELFEMAEGETANSVAVLNALLADPSTDDVDDARLRRTVITTELQEIDDDLDHRWHGALFFLSPRNPDAARHFCTSAREILVRILDMKAPDKVVLAANPAATLTPTGQVTRREKIRFCLTRGGQQSLALLNFVDDDIDNVMDLFNDFNSATHGESGRFDMLQLGAIKTRVEGAIQFLQRVVT